MQKRASALGLSAAIIAYLALWLLVPKATFMASAITWLSHTASHAPKLPAVGLNALGFFIAALPTIAFMAIQIGIIYFFAKTALDFKRSLASFVLSVACGFGIMSIIVWQSGMADKLGRALTLREQMFVVANYITPLTMPYYLCIMLAAIGLGYVVSLRIKDKNLLLPVVMFAAYIDFWTVTRGPVSKAMERAPEVVQAVSTPIPQAGAGTFMPSTMIGPGDFIFMGLVFAAVHRFGMRPKRNYWSIFAAMTVGMLAVTFGLVGFLPALTVLAVAVVLANWREFKLSREEKISTAIVGVLLLASLPIVWSLFKH